MLKIKDNVDLKQYGFEEYSSIWFKDYLVIDKETREVQSITKVSAGLLFDLIQAGLVEKVEDKQNEI